MRTEQQNFLGIKSLFLSACEEACNRALNYDESSKQRLAELHGKSVAIETYLPSPLGELPFNFFLYFYESGLIFSLINEKDADATISASTFQLLIQMIKQQELEQNPNVFLSGDRQLIIELEDILNHLDIDWEEPLSQLTGDIIAHEISKTGKRIFSWIKKAVNNNL